MESKTMKKMLGRWLVVGGILASAVASVPVAQVARGEERVTSQSVEVASSDQLKEQAFAALREGKFAVTSDLLNKAAQKAKDSTLEQMAKWSSAFDSQWTQFTSERKTAYDKAVADVRTLEKHQKETYAVDSAARAYLLADDKNGFRKLPWVDAMVVNAGKMADTFDQQGQWVKALRLYSDLSAIEPSNPAWKDKLKLATRRLSLLALYTPDKFRKIQDAELKDRDAAEALIRTTTQPTSQPVANADEDKDDEFKNDWHDQLKGIKLEMLTEALHDANINYWRDISYKDLIGGGLKGIRAVLTTPDLSEAFPSLNDKDKTGKMLALVDDATKSIADQGSLDEDSARSIMLKLKSLNDGTINLPEEVLVNEFANGAFAELDPFSNIIWPYEVSEFTKQTSGEFSGVGIQIQSDPDGSLRVVSPLEDSPAYKLGVKPDDIITHINGKKAKGISLTTAVATITGPAGTTVNLTIKSTDGSVHDYAIKRETIKVASIKGYRHHEGGGWDWYIDSDQKIAYLRLTNFTKTTGDELNAVADDLKSSGAKGIILDLRYNPGGLLSAATEVADKFLAKGIIVSTHADRETPNAPTVATAKPDSDEIHLPLIVLVNQYSASASEIVSGALKDLHRALIVGERTFGKGSVQMLFPLEGHHALLKLTTSHYYLPSGRCLHRDENSTIWGVDPDVKVEMTPEQMRSAIDSRQDMDVLREATAAPDKSQLKEKAKASEKAVEQSKEKKPHKDLLEVDPQLAAALLMMRLEVTGAKL